MVKVVVNIILVFPLKSGVTDARLKELRRVKSLQREDDNYRDTTHSDIF